jgi:hypothetical protein
VPHLSQTLRPAWALSLLGACAASPTPCLSPSHCAGGEECLANRCVALGAEPVRPGSSRLVFEPEAVGVVREGGAAGVLSPTVTFGGSARQSEALVVRFPHGWAALELDAAFLLLTPAPEAEPTTRDVPLEIALASGDWTSGVLSEEPRASAPKGRGLGRTQPGAVLRIDVTSALGAVDPDDENASLLVRASESGERGATYLTGAVGGAPRLEVYGRPRVAGRE